MDKYTKTDYSDIIIKNGEIIPTTNVVSELNQLNKENKALREGIEATIKRANNLLEYGLLKSSWKDENFNSNITCKLLYLKDEIDLLSTSITPIPKDKE